MSLAISSGEPNQTGCRIDGLEWQELMLRLDDVERSGNQAVVLAMIDLILDVFEEDI